MKHEATRKGLRTAVIMAIVAIACAVGVDHQTHAFFVRWSHTPFVLIGREIVTPFGKTNTLLLLLLVVWLAGFLRHSLTAKRASLHALGALVVAGLTCWVLKFAVPRLRPQLPAGRHIGVFSGYRESFPSGDAACAFAVALTLAEAFPRWRIPLILAAVVVSVVRVLRLAHWPSDVIAGATIGVLAHLAVQMWIAKRGVRPGQEDPMRSSAQAAGRLRP